MTDDDFTKAMVGILNGEISNAMGISNSMNLGQFPHPLTLERLVEQADAFKKMFPKMPPYYRVNQRTYDSAKRILAAPAPNEFTRSLISVELRIDNDVPDGKALPPKNWIEFKPMDPLPDRYSSYTETTETITIEEAKRRWPDKFEEKTDG